MAGCGRQAAAPAEKKTTNLASSLVQLQTPLNGNSLPKFVDPLPVLSGSRVDGTRPLQVDMEEFQQKVLPASVYAGLGSPFNKGTYLWGYNINGTGASWPARTIEARQGVTTTVSYTNSLVNTRLQNLLTVDQSLHWADPLGTTAANNCVNGPPLAEPCTEPYAGPIPAVVHLHGAEVLSQYDGHPDAWFTPDETLKGRGFVSSTYNYGNTQEATTLWYHDHSLGAVRTNVYAGLAGFYFIRDNRDTGLASNPITLPSGPQEVELLLQDRQFDTNGQLYFPNSDNPANLNGPPGNPDKHPFWIPEFFGDVITVNGKSWPVMQVQPRRYRFRMLNGSNARFFIMELFDQTGVDMHVNGAPGPAIWQIGSDGGLFDAPVKLTDPANGPDACSGTPMGSNSDIRAGQKCLFLAPAERADLIIDFAGMAGKTFTLKNFAVIPFPSGGPVGFGAPDATSDGLVMQFKVSLPMKGTDTSFNPASPGHPALRPAPMVDLASIQPDLKRQLILVEEEGNTANPDGPGAPNADGDPVQSLINNTKWNGNIEGTTTQVPGSTSNGRGISATETPRQGSTELWEVANLTGDAHPIHIHLIQFQVISRQPFDLDRYLADWIAAFPGGTFNGFNFAPGVYIPGFGPPLPYNVPNSAGALGGNPDFDAARYTKAGACAGNACPSRAPDALDSGWKDTIKMFPGEITRLAVRWAPQHLDANAVVAGQDAFPFDPTLGPGYVEHCHILDHEDNEFMRPLLIAR
ncbi:MAG TPA: multicopper oxidase domain-containing protein [Myxococcales bacterium]|nr:multicopper oxidase domain-containing protein [Myxococcales bacterium]